mmetsp:Transcript_8367/g.21279  ORF Transcript_8367/g.21279 Transcript_8367/m.21279 type:complete len:85 (+) Transcript_8367:385-639(+)
MSRDARARGGAEAGVAAKCVETATWQRKSRLQAADTTYVPNKSQQRRRPPARAPERAGCQHDARVAAGPRTPPAELTAAPRARG